MGAGFIFEITQENARMQIRTKPSYLQNSKVLSSKFLITFFELEVWT